MLSLRSCRSVDAAAAQLIVREAGGAVAFGDGELWRRRRSTSTRATRSPPPTARTASRPSAPRRLRRRPRNPSPQSGLQNVCSLRTYVRYTRALPEAPKPRLEEVFLFHGREQKRQQIENPGETRHHRSEKIGGQNRQSYANAPPPRPPSPRRTRSRPSSRPPSTSPSASSSPSATASPTWSSPGPTAARPRNRSRATAAAAQNAEADRASRHHRPPQGDHRGPQDPQPGRARGPQAPARRSRPR